jgi:hypothetical protein
MMKTTFRFGLGLVMSGAMTAGLVVEAASKIRWVAYKSQVLQIQVSVPSDWIAVKSSKALGFHTPGPSDRRAAIGILRSASGSTIEEAAEQQFEDAGRPEEWVRSQARVGGARAIKIVGWNKRNPGFKLVQYYVESSHGPYLITCLAPEDAWNLYSPVFAEMLTKFQFLY